MILNLNFTPFPVFTTERLILRKLTKNDASDLFRLRCDEIVMRFIDRPKAKSIADSEKYIRTVDELLKSNNGITWAISFKKNIKLIGTVGLWQITKEHFRGEIGYMLDADLHGKGLMHETLKPVLEYGFNVMNLHSIEANVNPGNVASKKLLEKNNFVCEAYFKENYFFDGRFIDTEIYSLLNPNHKQLHRDPDAE